MEGWFFVAATLLAVAGVAKTRDPSQTQGALAAAALPSGRVATMALGVAETVAGIFGLIVGGGLGGLIVAVFYTGFAWFVVVALHRGLPLQSCGCFGRSDIAPSPLHVVVNLLGAAGAMGYALSEAPSLPAVLADQPARGVPYLAFVAVGVTALYLIFVELPRLGALARERP